MFHYHLLSKLDYRILLERREEYWKDRELYACEGEIDALTMLQAGFLTSVGTTASSFKADDAELMRLAGVRKVVILFDGDAMGLKGAKRTAHIIDSVYNKAGEDVDIKIASIS